MGYIGCSSPDGWDNDCCSWGAPPPDWAWGSLGFGPNPYMHGACSGDAGVGVPVPPQDYPEDTWQSKKESEQAHIEFTSRWLSRCLRAAGAVTREWCGAGPRELGGWDEFLPDFECSVRKAASGAGAGLRVRRGDDAGRPGRCGTRLWSQHKRQPTFRCSR